MELTLEMVDQLRARAKVSFSEAVKVLEKAEGDVVKALLLLEGKGAKVKKNAKNNVSSLEGVKYARVSRVAGIAGKMGIRINKGRRTLTEVPFLLALGTTFFFPKVWAWFVLGALAARCSMQTGEPERNP